MSAEPESITLIDALSSGIPLIEYEAAFGWNDWDSPIHEPICKYCDYEKEGVPTPIERHAHAQKCTQYREWRNNRWINFNNSLIGKLLAIQFRTHWFSYYPFEVTQESGEAAVAKLLGNFVPPTTEKNSE
jgi:hypothetical protein